MNDNNKLHKALCQSLDRDVETISTTVQARLTRMRMDALAELSETQHHSVFGFFNNPMKVGAVFASVLFVVLSSFIALDMNNINSETDINGNLTIDELIQSSVVNEDVGKEFFLTEEDLDFFENLELYQWLDTEFKIS
jgi:hypothetical protein